MKGFDKSVISVFSEVWIFIKWLKAAATPNKNIWDSIAIIVITDLLYKDFKYVISGLLEQRGEKSIDKIQFILAFSEAKFLSKRAVEIIVELIYISKNNNQKRKSMATIEDKYFNYYKIRYFRKNCRYLNYKSMKKKSTSNIKQDCKDSPRPKYHNFQ